MDNLHDTCLCEFRIFHPCPSVRPILGLLVRLGCASPCAARSAGLAKSIEVNYQSILILEFIHMWPGSTKSAPFSEYSQPMIACFPLFPDRLPDHLQLLYLF
jgi:hypothetical protein